MTVNDATKKLVRQRAKFLCEYCHSSEEASAALFSIDRKFGIQAPLFYDGFILSWISISISVLSLSCQPGIVINCSLIPGLSLRQIGSLANGLSLIKPSLCFFWNVITSNITYWYTNRVAL